MSLFFIFKCMNIAACRELIYAYTYYIFIYICILHINIREYVQQFYHLSTDRKLKAISIKRMLFSFSFSCRFFFVRFLK